MDNTIHTVLDVAPKSRQLHRVDLRTKTYSCTKIQKLKNRQIDYKVVCQLSDDQLLCYYYDNSFKKGRIFYINSSGNISYGGFFDFLKTVAALWAHICQYLYNNVKGIKYKNYVYLMGQHCGILRYNLLKNTCSTVLQINFGAYSLAIIDDKILIVGSQGRALIYDCSINSVSSAFTFQSLWSISIGTINKTFFLIDYQGVVVKSGELNPYEWTLLGKIFLHRINLIESNMLNYDNLTYFFSKGNLYKFDLEYLNFSKIHFAFGKKEPYFEYTMQSLKFIDITINAELNSWADAFKPIEHYFINQTNYIEQILQIAFNPSDFPIKFLVEYPVFENRKVIIIDGQDSYGLMNWLNYDRELFGCKNKCLSMQDYWNNNIRSLKNWSKQGVIVPNLSWMVYRGAPIKEIIEIFKNGKKGLIWLLIGRNSRVYYEFIYQNEDKVIYSYDPEDKPFQLVNQFLKEAGEEEIDWRIWI
ncbi:unnamed protein product [Blepharisma stoltei]|uniref:Uncharacterized protein n=1 Tax=Blepharisma stoltei TaxID=1481888 RepID=A0AAU9IQ91_9CILI|nr:unnamed protein product [Blepharisma stoltei]